MGRSGCSPLVLFLILLGIWWSSDGPPAGSGGIERIEIGRESPRRPPPFGLPGEDYVIQDPGPMRDSQGTAFVVSGGGLWLTAQHVTGGCDRIAIDNRQGYRLVGELAESREADVSAVLDGPSMPRALVLSGREPRPGERGWHMGFPRSQPAVVASRYIGSARARRGMGGGAEPVLAWAEEARFGIDDGVLSGISGGPTFDSAGAVIGINSASTDRRGRILTADPAAVLRLVDAAGSRPDGSLALPLASEQQAVDALSGYLAAGIIRPIYCDVR